MAKNKSEKLNIGVGSYLVWGALHDPAFVGIIVRATATRWVVQPLATGAAEVQVTRSGLHTIPSGADVKNSPPRYPVKLTTSVAVQAAREDADLRRRLSATTYETSEKLRALTSRFSGGLGGDVVGDQEDIRDAITWMAELSMIVDRVAALDIRSVPRPLKMWRHR